MNEPSEMVEHVAWALFVEACKPAEPHSGWSGVRNIYEERARAAILAMRKPTEAMIESAAKVGYERISATIPEEFARFMRDDFMCWEAQTEELRNDWRAAVQAMIEDMIDAALK